MLHLCVTGENQNRPCAAILAVGEQRNCAFFTRLLPVAMLAAKHPFKPNPQEASAET
jgi:hypothetical protein